MKYLNKYILYYWRVIDSGFSWTGTSLLIGTKILFFIISSIILTGIYITGILLSYDSSILVKDNIEIILISITLSSYFIVHRIDMKHRSIYAKVPIDEFPVKSTDRMKALALAICSILLFVVVVIATIR